MLTRRLTNAAFVLAMVALMALSAYAAIASANKRRSSAGDYEVPDGGINTAGERRASAGDYSFGLGDVGVGSGCKKRYGDDLGYIFKCP